MPTVTPPETRMPALHEHPINLPLVRRGKVRDVYQLPPSAPGPGKHPADHDGGGARLLMVASDRISAFDVVMPTPINGKGRLLTEIATWWFGFIQRRRICQTHLLSTSITDLPAPLLSSLAPATRDYLNGRITICRACEVIPVECVVRGYLEGSGWKEYQQTGSICGVALPRGLRQCDRLPEPIFTPATKAAVGHDENISFDRAAEIVGLETAGVIRDLSLSIYNAAAAHALSRGIIIADTKFEFGIPLDEKSRQGRAWVAPVLIDEALTPDSSRFWPADTYQPGRPQKSFDKQFLREHLEELVNAGTWDKTPPGPELPPRVVEGTLDRYRAARDALCRE
jgi:phosphoribosylaminoimidazole-succinocarboxamide synthase